MPSSDLPVDPNQVRAAFIHLVRVCQMYDIRLPPKIANGMPCFCKPKYANSLTVFDALAPEDAGPGTTPAPSRAASVNSIDGMSDISDISSVATEALSPTTGETAERVSETPQPLTETPVAAAGGSTDTTTKSYTCTHCGAFNAAGQRLKWHVVVVGRRPGVYSPEEA